MAALDFALFWLPVAFGFVVLASYVGTRLALRTYFEDEHLSPSDFVRVDTPDDER